MLVPSVQVATRWPQIGTWQTHSVLAVTSVIMRNPAYREACEGNKEWVYDKREPSPRVGMRATSLFKCGAESCRDRDGPSVIDNYTCKR